MGQCLSVSSSEIHEENEYGDGNAVMCHGEESGLGEDGSVQVSGSVWSIEGSKGLNQDAAILYLGYGTDEGQLCGVFDGHGKNGHRVSKMVRNRLPSLLLTHKSALLEDSNRNSSESSIWEEACLNAFKIMDREIQLQAFDCSTSGTTAVVAILQGDELVVANLGDSRAVLGTTIEGEEIIAVQLTTDLKPGVPTETERIKRCNGRVFALKVEPRIQRVWLPYQDVPGLAMSRAFGDFLLKNYGIIALPEVFHRSLTSNDQFLILATDGVWDVLSNDEVASIVWRSEKKQATAAKLVAEAAKAAWKKRSPPAKIDDITVACLFLKKRQQLSTSCEI